MKGSYPESQYEPILSKEDRYWWFIGRRQIIVNSLKSELRYGAKFLDLGCGTGYILSGLSKLNLGASLFGADMHDSAIRIAKKRVPKATFFREGLGDLPESSFDVVGLFDVLEHIEDDKTALRSISDLLLPGGVLLVTVPQHSWLWSKTDESAGHYRRYEKKSIVAMLQKCGFKVVFTTSFVMMALPLMAVSRWLERINQRSDYLDKQFEIHDVVNQVLLALLRLEAFLIQCGISLPVGGSLMVKAEKR